MVPVSLLAEVGFN